MIRSNLIVCSVASAILLTACHSFARDPLFKLTLKVVDEEGTPVVGAQARIGAERRSRAGESEGKGVFADGITDERGYYSGEVEAWNASRAGYRVQKEGYYGVWLGYRSKAPARGKWQPWNPTIEVTLKKMRNPVPMYAKRQEAEIPVSGVDVGYDLLAGDWVAPYGRGKTADMLFHTIGEVSDTRNYRGMVIVTFPGQGNGLIPHEVPLTEVSPLRMPYEAPADGYEPKLIWRSVRKYSQKENKNEEYIDDSSKTKNFFVRVRSELDAEGKVVKAMYGKIHAPFIYDARGIDPWGSTKKQYVAFTYYVNPDGTQNIEFDRSRNLFKPVNEDDSSYRSLAP
jgi:hypothetical protein